jgi:hypothetical protein
MTREELLSEAEELLRIVPHMSLVREGREEGLSWLGRVSAVIEAWDPRKGPVLRQYIEELHAPVTLQMRGAFAKLQALLHQARTALRMETVGPLSTVFPRGGRYDYFDELRKIIETARRDVLFVDPYLDAEFVSRYLSHISPGVNVRLLAREKLSTLLPAVALFVQQSQAIIEVRSAPGFHDRYLFIDGIACYQSGASFKDGARTAPTTLTQIIDALEAVLKTYEDIWAQGKVEG